MSEAPFAPDLAAAGPCSVLPCRARALPCCLAQRDVAGLRCASLASPWEPGPRLSWARCPQPHDPSAEEVVSALPPESGRASSPTRPRGLCARACPQNSVSRMRWADSFCPAAPSDGLWQDIEFICFCLYSLLGLPHLGIFYFIF